MKTYRIVDLRHPEPLELEARGPSPESAATVALGISVVRSGAKKDLVAKAYWHLQTSRPTWSGSTGGLEKCRLSDKLEPPCPELSFV
jgi:hypothetical protein